MKFLLNTKQVGTCKQTNYHWTDNDVLMTPDDNWSINGHTF